MSLSGSTFCITGTLSRLRRDIEALLQQHGATVSSTVTTKTTHLLCNGNDHHNASKSSSKWVKAQSLGVTIVSEETVMAMIGLSEAGSGGGAGGHYEEVGVGPRPAPQPLTTDIANGQQVMVAERYVVKNIGGVYSCSCPSWKFQSKPSNARTCKHIQEIRGEAAERDRIGTLGEQAAAATSPNSKNRAAATNNPTISSESPAKKQKTSSSSVDASLFPGGLFVAANLMLANSWKPDKGSNYQYSDYLISEKLDGMRALWDGKQLVSRAGNKIHAPDFFTAGFPATTALDGELFSGRGQFQQTVSIARRQNGGEAWRSLKFVVFDAPSEPGGFEDRLATVFAVESDFVVVHPHEPCRDQQHLEAELARIENLGGEGLMLRKKQSAYRNGRTDDLLKVKTFVDDEAIVYGHQDGKGRHSGNMGALLCRLLKNNQVTTTEFKVGTGFSDDDRKNPPPVGSVITFRYFEMTKGGVPRFPSYLRMRPDIDTSRFAPL
jgi:DNA ligase 1